MSVEPQTYMPSLVDLTVFCGFQFTSAYYSCALAGVLNAEILGSLVGSLISAKKPKNAIFFILLLHKKQCHMLLTAVH